MSERSAIEGKIDALLSRAQIIELGARYCAGLDRDDAAMFLAIWHPEGEYVIGREKGHFKGSEQLKNALGFVRRSYASTRHWTTNHIIELRGSQRAQGLSDSFAVCTDHDGKSSLIAATYEDEYVRVDEEWQILTRVVTRWFVSDPMELVLTRPLHGTHTSHAGGAQ